jgi:tRNA pseudouridine13 synthase
MSTPHPVFKHQPADFVVREVLVPRTCDPAAATYEYYLLRKTGFSTMEAVRMIADAFNLPSTAVTYGGLKDEDAVTEQLVALPLHKSRPAKWEHRSSKDACYLHLVRHDYGDGPLSIGGLEGNAFRITVRNLASNVAERLFKQRKLDFYFLNYYDIQRFGVPGGRRRTHLVGAALLAGRWEDALAELIGLRSAESNSAILWHGKAEDYFRQLDPRTVEFYLSAHGSAQWNAELRQLVDDIAQGFTYEYDVEGIEFTYIGASSTTCAMLSAAPELAYPRYAFGADGITTNASSRTTVIQTRVAFDNWRLDDFYPGKASIEARFFLPSGSYATAALRQLFGRVDLMRQI